MDTINAKLAIPYLQNEINEYIIKNDSRNWKKKYSFFNRCVGKIFKQYNPYRWIWTSSCGKGSNNIPQYPFDILHRNKQELVEKYNERINMWAEYTKLTGINYLPYYQDWKDEELTCLHILLNKIRYKKRPHTKNDEKYENLAFYKDMYKRLEVLFPILPVTGSSIQESTYDS